MARTTLVTAVEVRPPDGSPITIWEMPVSIAIRDDYQALVFHTSSELMTVTVLMSDGDREDLIRLLGGRKK